MQIYKSRRYRCIELLLRWQARAGVRLLLRPFASCYHLLSVLRLYLYRYHLVPRHRLPATTISIGNIASGGSGKTPIVIAIGRQLEARGERVVVLSRGYGSSLRRHEYVVLRKGEVVLGNTEVRALDEPRLLAQALPQAVVIAAPRRYAAWQAYLAVTQDARPTCFLLDDGFQHVQIERDLDIVLLDAVQPFADGCLLPCGRLREPCSALRRADLVLFTRATAEVPNAVQVQRVQQHASRTVRVKFDNSALQPASRTSRPFSAALNPVLLICGVASPARVLAAVQKLGAQVRVALYLADHEAVDRAAVCRLSRRVNALVMTAKDYWRDRDFYAQQSLPVYVVTLTTDFDFARWRAALL